MAERLRVWHIGRRGEVPGGMTQVVNGYLAWPFRRTEQNVVVSRDGSKGIRAIVIVVKAVFCILALRPRTDVAVAHLSQGGSFVREGALLVLARVRGLGTVAQLHGSSFASFAAAHPRRVKFVLSFATRILTLSQETSDVTRRMLPRATVVQVPNAVPTGTWVPKKRTVVFGGNVAHRKGVDVLLAAWRDVPDRDGWRLLIAGPVADTAIVDDRPDDVDVLGSVEHSRLMRLLDEASIAILPSRDEAMPMFILEAMARKASIIATTVGGIPAVLADGAGDLVKPGDIDGLRAALDRAMHDEEHRTNTAAIGFERFLYGFSAEAVYPRVEDQWIASVGARRG